MALEEAEWAERRTGPVLLAASVVKVDRVFSYTDLTTCCQDANIPEYQDPDNQSKR